MGRGRKVLNRLIDPFRMNFSFFFVEIGGGVGKFMGDSLSHKSVIGERDY